MPRKCPQCILKFSVIGAGMINADDDELVNQLRWTTLMTIPNAKCSDSYDDILSTVICADGLRSTTCYGDSGVYSVYHFCA